jgi:hypothetical protein
VAEVTCVDGSVLTLVPVPVTDRTGTAYEVTLRLLRDGVPFGDVGECCGWRLARTADQLRDLQELGPGSGRTPSRRGPTTPSSTTAWSGTATGRSCGVCCPATGSCCACARGTPTTATPRASCACGCARTAPGTRAAALSAGRWSLRTRAVLDAWGSGGTGVRALFDGRSLLELLDRLLDEAPLARDQGRLQAGGLPAEGPV